MIPSDVLLNQDSLIVAPQLLGWELISHSPDGVTGGYIVEVEAYHGQEDPASHAFRGLTTRTAPMFAAGGTIYVYLSYGLHTCLNIVTGPAGQAQAVLIRALGPTQGLELMQTRRHQTNPLLLTNGPGRVGQALGISRELSGTRLGDVLELRAPTQPVAQNQISRGPRVGVSQAADKTWRFWLAGNPYVSRAPKMRPKPQDVA